VLTYRAPQAVGLRQPIYEIASRSRVSPNGLIVGHYERGGEIKIGDTARDSPSEREIARQERMKREG
jgi:hypothetical protein